MSSKKLQIRNPKQLVFIKELFLEAKKYASGHELELDLLKAILLVDLCVERLLNILWKDAGGLYSEKGKRYPNFSALWDNVERALKDRGFIEGNLVNKSDFIDYHERRNDAQHRGMVPRASYVQEYLELAENFFVKVYKDLYEFDFLNFRYWDLIKNQDLKRLLQETDEVLKVGDILLAFAGINLAYEFAVEALKDHLFKSEKIADEVRFTYHEHRAGADVLRPFAEKLVRLLDVKFDMVYTQFVREQLGLSKESDEKFNKVRHGVISDMTAGGELRVVLNRDRSNFRAEDATFALSYIYDLIIRIEERYPGSLGPVRVPGSLLQLSLINA